MMRFKSVGPWACLLFAVSLSGCAANRYCARPQPYDNARSVPPIQAVEGLKVPESATAMRVPADTAQDAPYGVKVEDPKHPGKTKYQCLDQPPPMPPPAPEPKAAS
jgi:uncharacterized lipoprotein